MTKHFKLHIILFILVFFLPINDVLSQISSEGFVRLTQEQIKEMFKNFHYDERQEFPTIKRILDTMKMEYFSSDKFIFENKTEEFKSLPRFEYLLRSNHPILESKDGEFVGLFVISAFYLKDAKKLPSTNQLNESHFLICRNMVFLSHGLSVPKHTSILLWISWRTVKRKMHYQPSNYLDNNFNADTIITYKIRLKSKERFREKYTRCEGLILTKTNVGCVAFYCFYTKAGYK
jgi:hypothetical protein